MLSRLNKIAKRVFESSFDLARKTFVIDFINDSFLHF
jgi:hypothetical protein